MIKNKKLKLFLALSVILILSVNLTLISGYLIMDSYGKMYLNPGEEYVVNLPFNLFQPSEPPVVRGIAQQTDGTPIIGVKVIVNNSDNSISGENTTDSNGEYSITLLEINEREQFHVYIEYDDEILILEDNDYSYEFDNNLNYSKSAGNYVELRGTIENEDAIIENGRVEISLRKCTEGTNTCSEILDTKTYYVNINPQETYNIPSSEINYTWPINNGTETGKYKIQVAMSFNAQEHTPTSMAYFYITD